MPTLKQIVMHRKSVKRGYKGGHSSLSAPVAQSGYEAADLHNKESQGASAGQGFVPDWNPGSSLFARRKR